jgi:cobalt-zinc-cadmium efflux system membrane fusion protein
MSTACSPLHIVFICALAIQLSACESTPHDSKPAASPVPNGEVHLAPDSPQLAALTIDTVVGRRERTIATLPAHVAADENHTARLLSPVSGRVSALYVEPGNHVKAGQPLALLVSADASQASSDLAKATAQVAVADAALARASDLFAHHVVAQRELEQAQSDVAQSHAEQQRARERIAQLGLQSGAAHSDFTLRAPIDGVVIDRSVTLGSEVRPDAAQPLFTISSMQHVWLTANVNQREMAHVRVGTRLVFTTDAIPGHAFNATISYVSAVLDPATRTGSARAVIDNPDGALRPEMFGEARILEFDSSATPTIATRALITSGQETVVYVELSRGTFVRRVVHVGDDDGKWASITSGLHAGERVVTDGSLLLDAELSRGS